MSMRVVLLVVVLLLGCAQRNFVGKSKERKVIAKVTYSGGSGESSEEAVVIKGVTKKSEVVAAEYQFITQKHGARGTGWSLVAQTVVREKNKILDVVEIELGASAGQRIYYFDVTEFLWKGK